jgi:5'(3')-deoxyribonucleotidase
VNIFIDMDGVVANFHKAACLTHGKPELMDSYPLGVDVDAALGFPTREAFWQRTYELDPLFWDHVEEFPWFPAFYYIVVGLAKGKHNVAFLSKPDHNPHSHMAKAHWLQTRIPANPRFEDFVLTRRKELLAHPGAVLIDDDSRELTKWMEHGGHGIVFRQPWNGYRVTDRDRLDWVCRELETVLQSRETLARNPK